MKKIISIIVVIILIAVVIYLYVTKSSSVDTTPGKVADTIDATASISDAVDKSNPFSVKVDPYQGYKNPFGQN